MQAQDKKEIDHNDYWYIKDNPLSKVGVFPYLGKQISDELEPDAIYYVLRPEEELNNKDTLNSFRLVPIVDDHTMLGTKPGMQPAEEKGVHGVIGDDVYYKDGIIYGDLKIFSESLKEEIENGKKELSMGYFCDYEIQPGEYNGKEYHIRLTGCSIFPQSYPAIITRLNEFSGITLLADIGSGTLNILYFNRQKPLESRMWTEKLGVRQCMITAENAVMDSFGIKIDPAIIEQIIRTGTADIPCEYLDVISAVCRSYCHDIFDTLRRYEYNPDLMHLYIVGGGGSLIRHFADYDKSRVTIIEDLSATAKGYEALAYNVICRKERS